MALKGLLKAIEDDDRLMFGRLLKPEVCQTPEPLICAIAHQRDDMITSIRSLMAYDTFGQQNSERMTALMMAVQVNRFGYVKQLIQYEPEVHLQNKEGYTALDLALINGQSDIIQYLKEHIFIGNIGEGEYRAIKKFLDEGGNPNTVSKRERYRTALSLSITRDDEDTFKQLIKAGGDVNLTDSDGMTPLIFAVSSSSTFQYFELLLAHGADVNHQNPKGWSALMQTAYDNQEDRVKRLVEEGANTHLTDCDGQTALDVARAIKVCDYLKAAMERQQLVAVIAKTPQSNLIDLPGIQI